MISDSIQWVEKRGCILRGKDNCESSKHTSLLGLNPLPWNITHVSHYLLPLDSSFSTLPYSPSITSSLLPSRWSSVGMIEVSFPSVLAAGSIVIRELDGTCIISYLHLQELKQLLTSNQNKSKERNFNCSHQVVNSIHPHEFLGWQCCQRSLCLQAGG